ncbi:hypothetical protein IG611_02000 [Pectobacterium sp. A535-S3-A17]|nr:hypothetical protein [Pectobacterium quasiaquaticum]MBE5224156.1 hypothetical protein [Pectobacterium quasiaquaticum]
MVNIAINNSGIRCAKRMLKISINTIMETP